MKDLKLFLGVLFALSLMAGSLWLDTRWFRFVFRWVSPRKTSIHTNQPN